MMPLFLVFWILSAEPVCRGWQADPVAELEGVDVDASVLAGATWWSRRRLYQDEVRARLDALPVGTRCYLGRLPWQHSGPRFLDHSIQGACGLECADSPGVMPLLPRIDDELVLFGSYSEMPIEDPRLRDGAVGRSATVRTSTSSAWSRSRCHGERDARDEAALARGLAELHASSECWRAGQATSEERLAAALRP